MLPAQQFALRAEFGPSLGSTTNRWGPGRFIACSPVPRGHDHQSDIGVKTDTDGNPPPGSGYAGAMPDGSPRGSGVFIYPRRCPVGHASAWSMANPSAPRSRMSFPTGSPVRSSRQFGGPDYPPMTETALTEERMQERVGMYVTREFADQWIERTCPRTVLDDDLYQRHLYRCHLLRREINALLSSTQQPELAPEYQAILALMDSDSARIIANAPDAPR